MFLVKKEHIKNHKGQLLDVIVRTSGMTITAVAKAAGYDRTTYYNHIEEAQLPYKIISRYGKALKHDFSGEYPEEKAKASDSTEINSFEEMEKDRNYWRDKYYALADRVLDKFTKDSFGEL